MSGDIEVVRKGDDVPLIATEDIFLACIVTGGVPVL